ncbi:uncharacterized protein BDZ99DRAFT_567562 [Mytilinidion resinicola]|uniref:Uncharacterized protein n=1 Tax=Mytilinidion resinicola TaxID=574789 RepID=A0A6A6YY04_9PEZI|nr:uncharacterized protein BDZ99DRAFT_567562 [Mytilinidion resinicola]KAF2813836.1 hypothetical protein BDZ99DRAFT_567562 [Mytilinidion resinicola]
MMGLASFTSPPSASGASSPSPSLFSLFLRAIIITSALHLVLSVSHAFYLTDAPFLPGLSSSDITVSGFDILTHTSVAPAATLVLSSLEYLTTQRTEHSRPYALFVSTTMFLGWLVSWIDWTACHGEWCRATPSPTTEFYAFIVSFAWWAGGLLITLAYAACGLAELAAMLGLRGSRVVLREVENGNAWPRDEKVSVSRGCGDETRTCGSCETRGKDHETKALVTVLD